MKIIAINDTIFKQLMLPFIELSSNEKIDVPAGAEFEIVDYLEISDHLKFTLKSGSLKGQNSWIANIKDVELVSSDNLEILSEYKIGDNLPAQVNLDVPYLKQLDNQYEPYKTCNVTCVAMCLYYFGIRPQNRNQQLEDELFKFVQSKGWNKYVHEDLRQLFIDYGVFNVFKTEATWEEVKVHLANKKPVIISGKFTMPSGHIVVLRGYDEKGFWVNDPYGEFFHSGYRTDLTGENLHYSYKLVKSKSYSGSEKTWAHFPEKH